MDTTINKITQTSNSLYLNTYEIDYTDKKGNHNAWYAASRRNQSEFLKNFKSKDKSLDAVLMAVYHVELKKLVIIKQFRVPLNEFIYEIPAGLIDDGETPIQSLKRELKEETGLELVEIVKSKDKIFSSCGLTDECFNIYFVKADGEISNSYLTDNEQIEILAIDQKDASNMVSNPKKMDMKALYVIELYSILGDKLFEK